MVVLLVVVRVMLAAVLRRIKAGVKRVLQNEPSYYTLLAVFICFRVKLLAKV